MEASEKLFLQTVGKFVKQWCAPLQAKVDVLVGNVRQLELRADGLQKDVTHLEKRSVPEYCGVWREGSYQRGDEVTHDGSRWIALADTTTKPGTANNHWQLTVKRGRDGKDGRDGMTRDEIEVLVRRIVREELTDTEVAA